MRSRRVSYFLKILSFLRDCNWDKDLDNDELDLYGLYFEDGLLVDTSNPDLYGILYKKGFRFPTLSPGSLCFLERVLSFVLEKRATCLKGEDFINWKKEHQNLNIKKRIKTGPYIEPKEQEGIEIELLFD